MDSRTLRLVPSRVSVYVVSLHAGAALRMQWQNRASDSTLSASAREFEGLASYYAEPYHGRRTASGEVFDTYKAMTAAHRTLPFNTVVRVQSMSNGKEVDVRINDRGPFIAGRIIDLSVRAARAIDMVRPGVVLVKLKIISQGTVPRHTALGTSLEAIQDDALDPLRAADDLVMSLDRVYEGATQ
jgi:rare lipoprotein A